VGCLIEESSQPFDRYTAVLGLAPGLISGNAHNPIYGSFAQAPQHVLL